MGGIFTFLPFGATSWFERRWKGDVCGALTCLALTCFLILVLQPITNLNGSSFVALFMTKNVSNCWYFYFIIDWHLVLLTVLLLILFTDWGVRSPHPFDFGRDQMGSNSFPLFFWSTNPSFRTWHPSFKNIRRSRLSGFLPRQTLPHLCSGSNVTDWELYWA